MLSKPRADSPLTRQGFVPLPRPLLDAVLCSDMGKRDLLLWLLVARLTYGAQGRKWAPLRPADLMVVGISPSHARECLDRMLQEDLLIQNGEKPEYRLNAAIAAKSGAATLAKRRQRLVLLITRQLQATTTRTGRNEIAITGSACIPEKGNGADKSLPKSGSRTFQKREGAGSHEGNASPVAAWRFSRSQRRFVLQDPPP